MVVRSFVAGLGVSVLLSMSAGCASSATNAQPVRAIDARAVAAPEVAPPPDQSEWSLQYAPQGTQDNAAATERHAQTVMRPTLATKKDKRSKHGGEEDKNDQ